MARAGWGREEGRGWTPSPPPSSSSSLVLLSLSSQNPLLSRLPHRRCLDSGLLHIALAGAGHDWGAADSWVRRRVREICFPPRREFRFIPAVISLLPLLSVLAPSRSCFSLCVTPIPRPTPATPSPDFCLAHSILGRLHLAQPVQEGASHRPARLAAAAEAGSRPFDPP